MSLTEMPLCPVCSSSAKQVRELSARYLEQELTSELEKPFSPDLQIIDYTEWVCNDCGLDFANPMQPGDGVFYKWITKNGSYYATNRWEFKVVVEHLKHQLQLQTRGIDIGCGSGNFVSLFNDQETVQFRGFDTNISAIEEGKRCGLSLVIGDITTAIQETQSTGLVDVVTSFHCIEHVADPLETVNSCLSLLRPGGAFYFSVPYSPTSLEEINFLPKNHAPHHMTRWNESSLIRLADIAKADIQLFAPRLQTSKSRAAYSLAYRYLRDDKINSPKQWKYVAVRHPIEYFKHWKAQRRRHHWSRGVAPDVILCRFQKR